MEVGRALGLGVLAAAQAQLARDLDAGVRVSQIAELRRAGLLPWSEERLRAWRASPDEIGIAEVRRASRRALEIEDARLLDPDGMPEAIDDPYRDPAYCGYPSAREAGRFEWPEWTRRALRDADLLNPVRERPTPWEPDVDYQGRTYARRRDRYDLLETSYQRRVVGRVWARWREERGLPADWSPSFKAWLREQWRWAEWERTRDLGPEEKPDDLLAHPTKAESDPRFLRWLLDRIGDQFVPTPEPADRRGAPTHQWLAADLAAWLRPRPGQRLVFSEIALGGEWGLQGRLDVVALEPRRGRRPFALTGYEVKASRADLLADLRAGKWRRYLPYLDRLYFALAAEAGEEWEAELPLEVGVVRWNAGEWSVTRGARRLRPARDDADVLSRLLSRCLGPPERPEADPRWRRRGFGLTLR